MELKNYTPHPITLLVGKGLLAEGITFQPAGPAPRLEPSREPLGEILGIPVVRTTLGKPVGLPTPEEGVVFVVSALVAEACPERTDLAYPGEAVRDSDGVIIGARGLCAGPGLAQKLSVGVKKEG